MDAGMQKPVPDGTQSTPDGRSANKKQKWTLLLAGTAGVLLVAGVLYQVCRPLPGAAQEQPQQQGQAPRQAKPSTSDAVARVNGAIITKAEVAEECMLSYGNDVLEKMINRRIIEQACAAQKVEVTEAEVDQEILKIAEKFNMSVDNWYAMLRTERNVTEAQYRRDIIWPMLALKKLAGGNVQITKKDMEEAFQRNYGERVKVKIIVLDNIRRANECWEKVNQNPEDFERLVRQYSIDSGSRALEGSVPPIRRFSGNQASEPLETAAFKLKKDEISGIVQTGNQFVIMKCEGRTEPVVKDLEDVKSHLKEELREEKIQQSVAAVFEKIKDEATVQNYITQKVQEGKKKSAAATPNAQHIRQVEAQVPAGAAPAKGGAATGRTSLAPRTSPK